MKCKKCKEKLEIIRMCRKIRLQCKGCGKEYHIHEVADQLDRETEELLSNHISIIYD